MSLEAFSSAGYGDVLVVDNGGRADEACVGDLVVLEAVDAAGGRIGRVVSLMNHGAGDVLEIAPVGGGETLLLPFTKGVVTRIDFDNGRVVIEPPREVEGE